MRRQRDKRLASIVLVHAAILLSGCGGGSEPLRTAPGTDTRSAQEKETDALLQKSQQEYNKRAR